MLRTQNQFPNALTTLASMTKIAKGVETQLLRVKVEDKPAFCLVTKKS